MKANRFTNIEWVNHIRAKVAWDKGQPIQVRHVRNVAWRDYNPDNPNPAFNNPTLRWRPASGYVSDDKPVQREFLFVGVQTGRLRTDAVNLSSIPREADDYLTLDSFTPPSRKPEPFLHRHRLTKINYPTAYKLCNQGIPIYVAHKWWKLAHLVRNTLDKDIFHEYYIETETYFRYMSTLDKPEQEPPTPPDPRTPEQAFKESRPAQEAWLRGEPIQVDRCGLKPNWRDYDSSIANTPHFSSPTLQWRPKPKPRRVPFTLTNVPANVWWRRLNGKGIAYRLEAVNTNPTAKLYLMLDNVWYSTKDIAEKWEFSIDLKTWYPAYTEVTE